jgi:hypothetical protein
VSTNLKINKIYISSTENACWPSFWTQTFNHVYVHILHNVPLSGEVSVYNLHDINLLIVTRIA